MLSIERVENTLQISKLNSLSTPLTPNKISRGLSSGSLEVFKTESELRLRPGSPDRYKSTCESQGITPSTKISIKDSPSHSSFDEDLQQRKDAKNQNLSFFLELDIEEVPNVETSFFSTEEKEIDIFRQEQGDSFNSVAVSEDFKTDKAYENIIVGLKESGKNYKNSCKIMCTRCREMIVTDVRIVYPRLSLVERILCSFCIIADGAIRCTYFCNNCKMFLTFRMDDLEFNIN